MNYDSVFLTRLNQERNRTIYGRIIALNKDELPLETIEGQITQGSINVDGASAVRRTCSLTLVSDKFDYSDYIWSFKTKFQLEVGIENTIDPTYPEICWFNQGIYVITSINTSQSLTHLSVTIQGKDKMCLLDGSIGGSIGAQTDFGKIEEENKDGNWTIRSIPLTTIIRNILHTYAGEPYHNIVINDLDSYGLELLEYRCEMPAYLIKESNKSDYEYLIFNRKVYTSELENSELDDLPNSAFESLVDNGMQQKAYNLTFDGIDGYRAAKLEYGQTAGYRKTELVYAGDLIANVGESLVTVLDKIKKMLVEFEYFYDVDGRFVFQKKRSFTNTIWSNNIQPERPLASYNPVQYEFKGQELITAFSNTPNISNVRNDYSIWGKRKGVSGAEIPILYRYAIDKKPISYCNIEVTQDEVDTYNKKYGTNLQPQEDNDKWDTQTSISVSHNLCDWREVIYQMALDYFKYNWLDDFELRVAEANPNHYPTGRTGYEQYYTDLQGFWRQIYNPDIETNIENNKKRQTDIKAKIAETRGEIPSSSELQFDNPYDLPHENLQEITASLEVLDAKIEEIQKLRLSKTAQFFQNSEESVSMLDIVSISRELDILQKCRVEYEQYKLEYENAIADLTDQLKALEAEVEALEQSKTDYNYTATNNTKYWHRNCFDYPELLNFWFDFLDTNGELSQFSVRAIGTRSKAVNDDNVKSIYNRDTPSFIFVEDIASVDPLDTSGYHYVQVNNIEELFTISAQGISAKNKLDELIYQHGYVNESVSITCLPIYHLKPNTRIYLYDEQTKIDGEYILSKITIPLTYNGTMSLTATKAAEYLQ